MNELSLFTGGGGGVLGTKLLNNWRAVGYVEWEKYCQQVLAQRIQDGFLDEAPIFGDIDDFIKSGASKKYAGYVDVVTAGFPCQPFSVAGKQKGQDDERNKWPQTLQCIRDVRPRYALLENVPGLLNSGYFGEILSSLAEAGFDARWCVLGADDVGAPHRRKRLWILAYPKSEQNQLRKRRNMDQASKGGKGVNPAISLGSEDVAYPKHERQTSREHEGRSRSSEGVSAGVRSEVADSDSEGLEGQREVTCGTGEELSNPGDSRWWSTEPDVGRVAHGVASRVDRLKAIGNGQVPEVAATAWQILTGGVYDN